MPLIIIVVVMMITSWFDLQFNFEFVIPAAAAINEIKDFFLSEGNEIKIKSKKSKVCHDLKFPLHSLCIFYNDLDTFYGVSVVTK